MFMKCRVCMDGPGPFEAIVEVVTINGTVELIVDAELVKDSLLRVEAAPIVSKNGSLLIELPREAVSGQTRVWVPVSETVQDSA